MRLFIGIELSDPVRSALGRAVEALSASGADARWTRPSNLHVTVQFLGEAADDKVPGISRALDGSAAERTSFAFSVAGLGAFPEIRRPLVVWAGVGTGREALSRAAASLGALLLPLGFPPDARPYHPHVTLGRVKSARGSAPLRERLEMQADTPFGSCEAAAFALFRSRQTKDGSDYEVLSRHPFGPA